MPSPPRSIKARFRTHLFAIARDEVNLLGFRDWFASTDEFADEADLLSDFLINWIVIPGVSISDCQLTISAIITWLDDELSYRLGVSGARELFDAIGKGQTSVEFWIERRIEQGIQPPN